MARQKSTKAKEPIKLRFKKLANGNQSIYLDYYSNGRREYDFLKLYIIPETNPLDKLQNAETLKSANAIKSQRIIELSNDEAGIKRTTSKILLREWLIHCKDLKLQNGQSKCNGKLFYFAIKQLERYNPGVKLANVDKQFCIGFINYLREVKTKTGKPLAKNSIVCYFRFLNTALNMAVQNNLITYNPISKICKEDKPKKEESKREYLTIDEVKKLILTEATGTQVKKAFLFSCFCGLRYSDIIKLKWDEITENNGDYSLNITVKKTQRRLNVPLSKEAMKWLPIKNVKSQYVFTLPCLAHINNQLKRWAIKAEINKAVTFHVARHTFATMMLTIGGDIYTISKLLGHSNISTTQIYAKIVDQKKVDVIKLTDKIFF